MKLKESILKNFAQKALEIEEWYSEGHTQRFCPFYSNRQMVQQSVCILLTSEQLLDPSQRALVEEYLPKSIIVLEDSDLFEEDCLDSQKKEFSGTFCQKSQEEILSVASRLLSYKEKKVSIPDKVKEALVKTKQFLQSFESVISSTEASGELSKEAFEKALSQGLNELTEIGCGLMKGIVWAQSLCQQSRQS